MLVKFKVDQIIGDGLINKTKQYLKTNKMFWPKTCTCIKSSLF